MIDLFFFLPSIYIYNNFVSPHPSPGMFANAEGVSQRAPVNWSEGVIGAAVSFPYVVALDESFITIHSMLDQQLKQTLSFRDGHILQDFEGINTYCFLQDVQPVSSNETKYLSKET